MQAAPSPERLAVLNTLKFLNPIPHQARARVQHGPQQHSAQPP